MHVLRVDTRLYICVLRTCSDTWAACGKVSVWDEEESGRNARDEGEGEETKKRERGCWRRGGRVVLWEVRWAEGEFECFARRVESEEKAWVVEEMGDGSVRRVKDGYGT